VLMAMGMPPLSHPGIYAAHGDPQVWWVGRSFSMELDLTKTGPWGLGAYDSGMMGPVLDGKQGGVGGGTI